MGHLYNTKYIQILLEEREDQVEAAYHFNPIDHVRKTGRGWVVAQNQISYMQSALYNESVICQSFIKYYNKRLMDVECTMWDYDHVYCKAVLWTRFVYIDSRTTESVEHEPELMDMFAQVCMPLEQALFEDRVKHYRQANSMIKRQNS